jgi:hypothetical protein
MEFKVQSRSKELKRYVELLMPRLIKELKLENSRKFVLVEIAKNAVDDKAYGATTNLPGLDSFVIALKPQKWNDLGSTLAHEMVHVKQFAKGQLQVKNGVRYWCGKKYTKRTKYMDQPWELEAFARQEIVFRRVAEK